MHAYFNNDIHPEKMIRFNLSLEVVDPIPPMDFKSVNR